MIHDKSGDLGDFGASHSSERLHRMKEIMHQIRTKQVLTEEATTPPIRSRTIIIFFSVVSVLLVVSSILYQYNWFVSSNEDVIAAQGAIANALQQRSNLFVNLVNLSLTQATMEQETMRFVAAIRSTQGQNQRENEKGPGYPMIEQAAQNHAPNQIAPLQGLQATAGFAPDAISRLFAVAEQYPDIKTSATYKGLMDKLMDLESRIHLRRDEYNEKVRIFNAMANTFPWRYVAYMSGFGRYSYFQSDPHRPDTKELTLDTNSFMRLVPSLTMPREQHDTENTPLSRSPISNVTNAGAMPSAQKNANGMGLKP